MKSGKRHQTDGMEQPNQDRIRKLGEKEYYGILEANTIKQVEMKGKIQKEYLMRTRKLFGTKLSCKNFMKGINTWVVSLVRYSGHFHVDQRKTWANEPKNKNTNNHAYGITSQGWHWQTIYVKKGRRKRIWRHWRQRWRIDTTSWGLHRKTRRRTNYGHRKRYWQHNGQRNDNN